MIRTKKLVLASLMAAFTCVATMVIKFPTPTLGYVHLGDALVLLCGIILGPLTGGLAAGIGSCLADLFSGYAMWAPGTFVIKALCAMFAGFLFHHLKKETDSTKKTLFLTACSGTLSELFMVFSYFLYEILLVELSSNFQINLKSAVLGSVSGLPFNFIQGITGVILTVLLLPILSRINDIRSMIS